MRDANWRTLAEIAESTGDPPASWLQQENSAARTPLKHDGINLMFNRTDIGPRQHWPNCTT